MAVLAQQALTVLPVKQTMALPLEEGQLVSAIPLMVSMKILLKITAEVKYFLMSSLKHHIFIQ